MASNNYTILFSIVQFKIILYDSTNYTIILFEKKTHTGHAICAYSLNLKQVTRVFWLVKSYYKKTHILFPWKLCMVLRFKSKFLERKKLEFLRHQIPPPFLFLLVFISVRKTSSLSMDSSILILNYSNMLHFWWDMWPFCEPDCFNGYKCFMLQ